MSLASDESAVSKEFRSGAGVARLALRLLGAMLGAAVCASACAPSPVTTGRIQSEPDFAGFVTAIEPGGRGAVTGIVVVESHADKLVRRVIVTVTNETAVYAQTGDDVKPVTLDTLRTQDQVRVWFTGPVTGDFPLEATARRILMVGRY